MSKSKRIKEAARELERALKKHVDVVTDSAVSMKKAQRAGARLASAAQLYSEAVQAKTGLDNPFLTGGGRLDEEATQSLRAERNEIAKTLTGSIATVEGLPAEVDLSAGWQEHEQQDHVEHEHHEHGHSDEHHEHSHEHAAPAEEQAPALPEEEPRSEEEKPYSEDI